MSEHEELSVGRFKRLLVVLMLVVAFVVAALALRQAGAAIVRASQGADPASAFNEPLTPAQSIVKVVSWLADPPRDGRPMEPATRSDITDAYAAAWAALDRAGGGDPKAPLDTYLAGAALTQGRNVLAGNTRTKSTHLGHRLQLSFYSDDGAIVAIDIVQLDVVRVIGVDEPAVEVQSAEAMRAVMVLEDGNWRLHLLERVGATI